MDSILQQLYNGGFDAPWTAVHGRDHIHHCREYFGPLLKDQAPELETKFNILMEDLSRDYFHDIEEMYYRGFGLAVKLFTEGLAL